MQDNNQLYDVAIIGGGINGCGIARDAAGRGLSVFLCEKGDLAHGTSSASTKLVHGGLRYLEYYEFSLVRKALNEREVLLRAAPHIIWPMRFLLPHHKGLRPAWMVRLGLFIYDYLGGRQLLPGTRVVDLRSDALGKPLKNTFRKGFLYSDCWVEDARLVVLNAMDAQDHGAEIQVRTRCVGASRHGDHWVVKLQNTQTQQTYSIRAKTLVNAAGPWVDDVLRNALGKRNEQNVRLVKGSHIVVKRLFPHERAYIFQNSDGRIVFAIPYERDFTLIGTTDEDYQGDQDAVSISDSEVSYLCDLAGDYFKAPINPSDVIWSYSGIRPLYDDGASEAQEATRDYVLNLTGAEGEPPLLSVFGGKITTYRQLSKSAMRKLSAFLGSSTHDWTAREHLPGGNFLVDEVQDEVAKVKIRYPFMSQTQCERLVKAYGTRVPMVLGSAESLDDLGQHFGAGLSQREVDYLIQYEWALNAEDVLWRRSKLGLRYTPEAVAKLEAYMQDVLSVDIEAAS